MTLELDRLFADIDLVKFAEDQAGAELTRSGRSWRGACPIHGGDNESAFAIYEKDAGEQRWKCFSGDCGGGDLIDLAREVYALPDDPEGFIETVQRLAEYAGIALQDLNMDPEEAERRSQKRKRTRRRHELLELAATYYRQVLTTENTFGDRGREYMKERGWSEDVYKSELVGMTDGLLRKHLEANDVDLHEAVEAGLLYEREDDGIIVDAIPKGYLVYIHKRYNRVTYLSGRSTFTDEQKQKSRNMHAPRQLFWAHHRRQGPLIVVEGPADALTLYKWDFNAVALCGTSIDADDARAMDGYTATYLMLDNGVEEEKLAKIADQLGPLTMIVADIPPHHGGAHEATDVNEWDLAGATAVDMQELLDDKNTQPWIEMAIDIAGNAKAFELEQHLERLADLMLRLNPTMRNRYKYQICDSKRLISRGELKKLMGELSGNGLDTNGFEVVDGELCYRDSALCNFAARITHELVKYNEQAEPEVELTISGRLADGEPLEEIEISADEFTGSMQWVSKRWGMRPIFHISPSSYWEVRRGIQEISKHEMVRERVYKFTGWTKYDGDPVFLTTSGGLGPDGLDEAIRVDLGETNRRRYELPAPPHDPREPLEASLQFLDLADLNVTVPLWAAMYAAPLGAIRTLDAAMWVYGQTQSGKSTISHLALTHFGSTFIEGHRYNAPEDWVSTFTKIENTMHKSKDIATIIDDYAPAHSGGRKAKKLAEKANSVVRMIGNRAGRGRSGTDLRDRPDRPPRGLVIVTAEQPLIGGSTVGRTIYVHVQRGQVIKHTNGSDETMLDHAQQQAQSGKYASAMAGYIQWLAQNWQWLQDEFPVRVEKHSRMVRPHLPQNQSRLTDYFGVLATSVDIALRYAVDAGALNKYDAEVRQEQYHQVLIDLLLAQGNLVSNENPVTKFWEAISDLLARGIVHFAPRLDAEFRDPDRSDKIGWYDDDQAGGYVYLMDRTALKYVRQYWQDIGEPFATHADALRRYMDQQGLLAETDEQFAPSKYINKAVGRKRCLLVPKGRLREFDLTFEEPEDGGNVDDVEF